MNTSSAPELNPNDQIQFATDHRVALEAGDYILDVAQSVQVTNAHDNKTSHMFKPRSQAFSVLCERYLLLPDQIHAAFPPPGGNGNYWRDLPHLILERSTLPWERTALRDGRTPATDPPWLALLLFWQGDTYITTQTKNWSTLANTASPHFPALTSEKGDHNNDQFTVIDVPAALLRAQLGEAFSFDYQTNVRRRLAFLRNTASDNAQPAPGTAAEVNSSVRDAFENCDPAVALSDQAAIECYDDNKKWRIRDHRNRAEYEIWVQAAGGYDLYRLANEKAVVMGNRLPKPGARNIVHLVSLEGRWDGSKFDWAEGPDAYRLVSLFQWEFFCIDPTSDFLSLMRCLNGVGSTPSGFHLSPPDKSPDTANFLNAGFVPLRHRFRQGNRSISWYHGPLVPGELNGAVADAPGDETRPGVSLPASAADKLLIFDQTSGMFDASYAAAWELGRMLMLRSTKTATALAAWKHRYINATNARRHEVDFGYALPIAGGVAGATGTESRLPDEVDAFLNDLALLHHVPFNYLVPDARLLPPESLRFFTVDRAWIECLRDGAFSIGRVTAINKITASTTTLPVLSGILLRSEIVSDFYSKLRVEGYTKVVQTGDQHKSNIGELLDGREPRYPAAKLVRMEQLSPHVLLCLFASSQDSKDAVQMVDIHLKQEMLHFGFDERGASLTDEKTLLDQMNAKREQGSLPTLSTTDITKLEKKLRDAEGNEVDKVITPIEHDSTSRVIKMNNLATAMKNGLLSVTSPPASVRPKGAPINNLPIEPAIFALEMIAGTQLGRFRRTKPS